MNQSRVWTVGAVLLIVALLAGTWFLGVAPRLSDARDADTAQEQAVSLNNIHRQTLAALQVDHERMDEILEELDYAHAIIPELPQQDEFVALVGEIARRSGVIVTDLSFTAAARYEAPDGASGEYLATATRLADGGFYVIPVTIEIEGSLNAVATFLGVIQSVERFVLPHDVQVLNEEGVGTMTIKGQLFGLSADTISAPEPTATPAPTQ